MKILLAPSKTINLNNSIRPLSEPMFQKQAKAITRKLLKLNTSQLQTLYKISAPLANNVYEMIHQSTVPQAAIGYYMGEVYRHLDLASMDDKCQNITQSSLRILSAMYGYLKAYDGIHPYRMDFLVDFKQIGFENSTIYWRERITNALLDECVHEEIIFNLASKEFSKMIVKNKLQQTCHWIDVDFLVEKDNKLMSVSMIAKKARGLLARRLIDSPIDKMTDIYSVQHFDEFSLDKLNSHPHYLRYVSKNKK